MHRRDGGAAQSLRRQFSRRWGNLRFRRSRRRFDTDSYEMRFCRQKAVECEEEAKRMPSSFEAEPWLKLAKQ
jgi:hypothetical protein